MIYQRLKTLIDGFTRTRIGVLGDFFLDKYLEIDSTLDEPSLETGKPAHQVVRTRTHPGAAGNVVCNLAALGAGTLHAIGVIGDDGNGYDLESGLNALDCITDRLFKIRGRITPTYMKPRDIHCAGLKGEYERYDIKNRVTTPPEAEKKLIEALDAALPELDALLVVDQVVEEDCGVVTGTIRNVLAERALEYPDVVFFVDSRSRILSFKNMIIKPNQFELMGYGNTPRDKEVDISTLKRKLKRLRTEVNAPVCVTIGARGILVSDPEPVKVRGVHVPEPTDPTGAGDSVSAGMVLALAAGATLSEAALVGNLAASVTVRKLAMCGVCRPDELLSGLEMWQELG